MSTRRDLRSASKGRNNDKSQSGSESSKQNQDGEAMPQWAVRLEDKLDKLVLDQANFTEALDTKISEFQTNTSTSVDLAISTANEAMKLVKDLEVQVNCLKKDLASQKEENRQLRKDLSDLECYSRKQNLVFDGIKEDENENCESVLLKLVKNDLGIELKSSDLIACHRLGQATTGRPRPLMVRFLNAKVRDKVWEKKTEMPKSISMKENFSNDVESNRKILYPIFRKAKSMEKYKNKVKLVKDKLVILGNIYTVNTLHTLPKDLDPKLISTPSQNGVTLFYGRNSPLSNFNTDSPIIIDQVKYNCVEQYYSFRKAQFANDQIAQRSIMKSPNPATQKAIANKVKVDMLAWRPVSIPILERALTAKFTQNKDCADFLLATGNNTLGEANPHDSFYATECSMYSVNAFKVQQWKGANKMGQLMEQVRDHLRRSKQ